MRLLGAGVTALAFAAACYSTGDGTSPPPDDFYFPTGLAVSSDGSVLYAVNSDFDLQFNGGTLQSYDLTSIKAQVVAAVERGCPPDGSAAFDAEGRRLRTLGETCVPPTRASDYRRASVVIGAFATDLQRAVDIVQEEEDPTTGLRHPVFDPATGKPGLVPGRRLYVPVRGNSRLTVADIQNDNPCFLNCARRDLADGKGPSGDGSARPLAPGGACGEKLLDGDGKVTPPAIGRGERCVDAYTAGGEDDPQNSRGLKLPGEPFAMAQSRDGAFVVLTHQADTKTTLFSTGRPRGDGGGRALAEIDGPGQPYGEASLRFILDGVASDGTGIASVPFDPAVACPSTEPGCPRRLLPAFLQTTRSAAEITLLRLHEDDRSTLDRPFLVKEGTYPVVVNSSGVDSRGIVIDPTPRITCGLRAVTAEERAACARLPARLFIANRSPPSLLIGEVGGNGGSPDSAYDATRVRLQSTIPLTVGPSRVYLAPIVDARGYLALRVFVVCFDSNLLYVVNPDTQTLENIIPVAPGPYAMAFDPFTVEEVAGRRHYGHPASGAYRFAYLASFLRSFVQVIDLDGSRATKDTFERVVFALGTPQVPKGS